MHFTTFIIGVCLAGCIWPISCEKARERRRLRYEKQYEVRYFHEKYNKDWISYGEAGYLYGYSSYLVRASYTQRNITPTICFSDLYDYDNGTYYESFVCPSEKADDEKYQCCGSEYYNEQYCCDEFGRIWFWITRAGMAIIVGVAFSIGFRQCYRKNIFQMQAVFAKCCKKGNQNLDRPSEMQPMNPSDGGAHYPRQDPAPVAYPPAPAGDTSGNPPQGQGYPPQGQGYPPQGQGYPPQGQGYPPQGQGYSPQGQGYPPQGQGYPQQGQSYPPQGQGYPQQGQGYIPGQGYAPPPPAYAAAVASDPAADIKGNAVIS